jgi:hypothetical protein
MAFDEAGYRDFVVHRLDGLRRTAYLLCGDWHTADDLVSGAWSSYCVIGRGSRRWSGRMRTSARWSCAHSSTSAAGHGAENPQWTEAGIDAALLPDAATEVRVTDSSGHEVVVAIR